MTHDSRDSRQYGNFITAADDILTPPPPPIHTDPEPAPQNIQAGLIIVVSANLAVMTVVITVMLAGGAEPMRAIIAGIAYFTITSPLYLVIVTGALSAIIAVCQREKTERIRIGAYADIAELAITWRLRIEDNRAIELQAAALPADLSRRLALLEEERTPPAHPVQPNTFVTAYAQEDATAQEARRWAEDLYLPNGRPDPSKVVAEGDKRGWLRIRMLGSKRGGGSREAGLWLLHRKVILRVTGGYCLNLTSYPTRESLRTLR